MLYILLYKDTYGDTRLHSINLLTENFEFRQVELSEFEGNNLPLHNIYGDISICNRRVIKITA